MATGVVGFALVGAVISLVTVTRYSPIRAVSAVVARVKSLVAKFWVTGGVGSPLMLMVSE